MGEGLVGDVGAELSVGRSALKGQVAIDPDSEIITDTIVTAGNAGDASVATDLIDDLTTIAGSRSDNPSDDVEHDGDAAAGRPDDADSKKPTVYGDSSFGTGELHKHLEDHGLDDRCKTQQRGGRDACSIGTTSPWISSRTRSPVPTA